MSKLIRNPCKTDLSEAEPHERQPNQEPGKSKQKSHQIAQSLEEPNLSPPKNQTSKKTPRRIPRPALLSSSPELALPRGGCATCTCATMAEAGKEGGEDKRGRAGNWRRQVLMACLSAPPAGQFAFFFYRFLVIHFAGAMILSRGFRVPGSDGCLLK